MIRIGIFTVFFGLDNVCKCISVDCKLITCFLFQSGVLFGENFVVNQVLPVLRSISSSCIDVSCVNKPEPLQSWATLALMDCFMTLDGLVAILKKEVVVKELIEV